MLNYFIVFLISMVPLIELRGAIPIAIGMGIEPIPAIITCVIGNMLPVPIIYFFARKFLLWGEQQRFIGKICKFFCGKRRAGRPKAGGKSRPGRSIYRADAVCGHPHSRHRGLDRFFGRQFSEYGH